MLINPQLSSVQFRASLIAESVKEKSKGPRPHISIKQDPTFVIPSHASKQIRLQAIVENRKWRGGPRKWCRGRQHSTRGHGNNRWK